MVVDTAPTGHVRRLMSIPTILRNAWEKVMELKDRLIGQVAAMMADATSVDAWKA